MNPMSKPDGIIIHHSLTKDGKTCDWDAIRRYHMTAPEYMMDDIGYHAGVERINGVVTTLTGRPINCRGGHTKNHNNTLGICIGGNFDLAPADDALLYAASDLVRGWMNMFPWLTAADVHRHSEYAPKSCPGLLFPWERFIKLVTR